ncbi:MAG: desulfoferrodoxin [Methanomassiliicoccales archaeon]|nr:MAG: desulfoferrodoxin [Methanomassiliicoccales archaeon]
MTKRLEVYKCEICGNIVEVLHTGGGTLVCCGQPMKLFEEKTADAAQEKHVPVVEKTESGTSVKVGSVPHPMEDAHYIEWIEIVTDSGVVRKFLKPGEAPEAVFEFAGDISFAREYCNVHGLWKS